MSERRNFYYHSPFYYGLIVWRRRLAVTCTLLIISLLVYGHPPVEGLWSYAGVVFGLIGSICFIRMWCYENYLLAAMGPLDNNTVVGSLNFDKIERKHAVWYEKKFGHKPPKTNTWSND